MAAPLRYAAMHRIHHRYSDKEFDPHSPKRSLFHAFLGWNWWHSVLFQDRSSYLKLVPAKHRQNEFLIFCDENVNLLQVALAATLYCAGTLLGGEQLALQLVLYGVFVKTLIVVWAANAVDVINHTAGYRNFETGDHSTNSFLMAALHLGGAISWHNNHHARPKYFMVKSNWWEFDVHHMFLKALKSLGAVKTIRVLDQTQGARKQVAANEAKVYG
ncbi:MAG: hypothetical protein AAF202_08735 [Pseudomonadota bacterium]